MAAYEYRVRQYSFQDGARADAAHADMQAMAEDGWHIHTASMNFVEVAVLWERNGSAAADRVKNHFEETGVLPVALVESPKPRHARARKADTHPEPPAGDAPPAE